MHTLQKKSSVQASCQRFRTNISYVSTIDKNRFASSFTLTILRFILTVTSEVLLPAVVLKVFC